MRAIAAEYFAGSALMSWPLLALVIFMAVFAIAAVTLIRRGRAAFDDVSRLPLEDDSHE